VGQGIGYLFILAGILIAFLHPFGLDWFSGLWLAFIGWFLSTTASASYRQAQWQEALQRFTASQIMTSDCSLIPSSITVSRLIQENIFVSGHRCFLVADEGELKGILTVQNIKSVTQSSWDVTQVKDVMTPVERLKVARPDQEALSLLEQMNESDINQMPVVSEGRVIGLVTRDNLMRLLRTRSELGV